MDFPHVFSFSWTFWKKNEKKPRANISVQRELDTKQVAKVHSKYSPEDFKQNVHSSFKLKPQDTSDTARYAKFEKVKNDHNTNFKL